MTISEKILAKKSGKRKVVPGEILEAKVDIILTHDPAIPRMIGPLKEVTERLKYPERIVVAFDHFQPPSTLGQAEQTVTALKFIKEQGIRHAYPWQGICHQIIAEKGHARPGMLIIGTDSHTVTAGAFGAFATGLGMVETIEALVTGQSWFKVPETNKFNLTGSLQEMVMAKDVIIHILGMVGASGASYKAVEFAGPTIREMSIDGRMVLSNMSVEMDAKAGIIKPDKKTIEYVKSRTNQPFEVIRNDPGAEFTEIYDIDSSKLEPQVAAPYSPTNAKPATEVEGTEITQAFIGSCTGGRLEDMQIAAKILKGKKVHPQVRLIVIPASREVYGRCLDRGLIKIFHEAGAMILNPGCGLCGGFHQGLTGPGDVMISTQNRNFLGRSGSPEAKIYLASPATCATSAIKGEITDPRLYKE